MSTYDDELAEISRSKIDFMILKMDYCTRTFGTSPCLATGTKCYNTYPTCKYISAYYKTTKEYKFTNADKPVPFDGARPYIKQIGSMPTEIAEGNTIVKRLKIVLYDEPDNDVGIDPYLSDRSTVQGTFWKKFYSRNLNYKGKTIELYRGFLGMTETEFTTNDPVFVGVIDSMKINGNEITLEAVDLLRSLKDVKYPLNIGIALTEDLGKEFKAASENAMLALDEVEVGDFCLRSDYKSIASFSGTLVSGGTITTSRTYHIYGYDSENRPFGYATHTEAILSGSWSVSLTWTAMSNVSYYRIFYQGGSGYMETTGTSYTDTGSGYTTGSEPSEARLIYELTAQPSSTIGNWSERHSSNYLGVYCDNGSDLDDLDTPSGYVQVGNEVIYYGARTDALLQEIVRGSFSTKSDRYLSGKPVRKVVYYAADNPFTILKSLLGEKISSTYIDTKFTTYESAWTDIDFSTGPVIKAASLAEIYFQAVDSLNCISWQGDDGKIKIIKREERSGTYTKITDESIVQGSTKVDLNESSRKTRWGLYWNRSDYAKSIKAEEGFINFTLLIDATSEGSDSYGDEITDERFTIWINDDCGTATEIDTYISALLGYRKARTNQAQERIDLSIELKDAAISTGDLIELSTDELQDEYGNDWNDVLCRVIKRDEVGNQIKLKLEREYS